MHEALSHIVKIVYIDLSKIRVCVDTLLVELANTLDEHTFGSQKQFYGAI